MGLIVEADGMITNARVFVVEGEIKADTWYTLKDGKLEEMEE